MLFYVTKAYGGDSDLTRSIGSKKLVSRPGLKVIKLEHGLRLKIKRNDWLLVDTCPQAANHCALF